jgi:preprotein translocase subunit SecE
MAQASGSKAVKKTSPAEFVRQVRREMSKVTWPTRKETMISTTMVLVLAVSASLFFLLVDNIAAWGIRTILGIGG